MRIFCQRLDGQGDLIRLSGGSIRHTIDQVEPDQSGFQCGREGRIALFIITVPIRSAEIIEFLRRQGCHRALQIAAQGLHCHVVIGDQAAVFGKGCGAIALLISDQICQIVISNQRFRCLKEHVVRLVTHSIEGKEQAHAL